MLSTYSKNLFVSIATALLIIAQANAFMTTNVFKNIVVESSTKLFLEDHIAEMIDLELLRLKNKPEYEKQMKEKNKKVIDPILPTDFDLQDFNSINSDFGGQDEIQKRRDMRMARNSPEKYCADRCVSTGHCDVYEDLFDMSADEVMQFCEECVLSEKEDPCDIPEKMYEDYPELQIRP